MRELVSQLYLGNWKDSVLLASSVVPSNQAEKIVEKLTKCPGWRERVVAAKVSSAFGLTGHVSALVQTFASNPETYTAAAFANLLSDLQVPNRGDLLAQIQAACPSTSYGKHLLEVIESACPQKPAP